jgi:hypothetical protein
VALGLGLLPIIPILLLPFAIVFFVVVFPLWGVALGVLGLLLLIARGVDWLAKKLGIVALEPLPRGLHTAFRWVLTFGGFAGRIAGKAGDERT